MSKQTIQTILNFSGVVIMLIAFLVVPDNKPWYYEVLLFDLGLLMVLIPKFLRGSWAKVATLLLLAFSTTISAQDYSTQVDAFAQSLREKSVAPMESYVSPVLKFDPVPVENTAAVLANVIANLPPLNAMTILESTAGNVKVKYDFDGLGVRESAIHFDGEGKYTRIELIENLIKMEMDARKKMEASVQLPTPGVLGEKYTSKDVSFLAADSLVISGDLYKISGEKPIILLMHQAGYNRLEYADIAPKLNELGYNCLAIDLRSGGDFAGKPNSSLERAREKGLEPEMIDAQQDIAAAIDFLNKRFEQKVILWGSSFSASLALLEGDGNPKVKGIIAFSPGDYFGEAAPSLRAVFAKRDKPFFVTSSKEEAPTLATLIGAEKMTEKQIHFIPSNDGFHGARALWEGQKGAEEYWAAVSAFLDSLN